MDRTERFHKITELLNCGRPVSRQVFLDALEVSLATFKRDRMSAPIVYSAEGFPARQVSKTSTLPLAPSPRGRGDKSEEWVMGDGQWASPLLSRQG